MTRRTGSGLKSSTRRSGLELELVGFTRRMDTSIRLDLFPSVSEDIVSSRRDNVVCLWTSEDPLQFLRYFQFRNDWFVTVRCV